MADKDAKRRTAAKSLAAAVLGKEPTQFVNPLTVLASPAWRGVEGDVWRAGDGTSSVIVKHFHTDTQSYVDIQSAIDASAEAGRLGVGPKVLQRNPGNGLVAFQDLSAPWGAGGLHHVLDNEIRSNVIAKKKAFQAGAKLEKSISIFDEIEALYALTLSETIATHTDIEPFMGFARDAAAKMDSLGWDDRPCHRDGNTANLMVHPDKSVRLIDFDLAANCDPFEDVGAYLIECFETDGEARRGFEEWQGSFDEGLFQRAMIYGLADDLRWGLIGSIMAAKSSRTALEFSKYAAWRFIRLQAHAKRSDANDRIRLAA